MTTIAIPLFPASRRSTGSARTRCCSGSPATTITFIGHERGVVRSDNGFLGIEVDATFDELPAPDVVVFPGGVGTRELVGDEVVLDWVRRAHETTMFTTSVCTGSLVLAAAGLLDGLTATTHWGAMEYLGKLGAIPSDSGSSSTSTGGSSRPPACRAASTWRCASSSCSSTDGRRGRPADDRVRPAAAVRRRQRRQGRRPTSCPRHRVRRRPGPDPSECLRPSECRGARTSRHQTLGWTRTLGCDGSDGGGAEGVAAGLAGLGGDLDVGRRRRRAR